MLVDQTFLREHKRTTLWKIEREQCLKCVHVAHLKNGAMNCTLIKDQKRGQAKLGQKYAVDKSCISARDQGAACGPKAFLFKEASC